MPNSGFVPFSMMGDVQKEMVNKALDLAISSLTEILQAPMPSKENLMKTDFKAASSLIGGVGRILQAESAMVQAFTVMADRAGRSADFRALISKNLPAIEMPSRQLEQRKK